VGLQIETQKSIEH